MPAPCEIGTDPAALVADLSYLSPHCSSGGGGSAFSMERRCFAAALKSTSPAGGRTHLGVRTSDLDLLHLARLEHEKKLADEQRAHTEEVAQLNRRAIETPALAIEAQGVAIYAALCHPLSSFMPYDVMAIYLREGDRLIPETFHGAEHYRLFVSLEIAMGVG